MTISDLKYYFRTGFLKPIVPIYWRLRRFMRGGHYLPNFHFRGKVNKGSFYFIIDPRYKHPGMADRLKAIIYCYNVCKRDGLKFYIIHKYPFALEGYLQPNKINWVANISDLRYVIGKTKFVSEHGQVPIKKLRRDFEYHCFNYQGDKLPEEFDDTNLRWGDLFQELFKPCEELQMMIDGQPFKPNTYVAVHIRFVNALENFESGYCNALKSDEEKYNLINRCKKAILDIYNKNKGLDVLVFSDSKTFLDSLADTPAKTLEHSAIGHISFDNQRNTILKTFLDMYMISRAKKVYKINAPELYASSCFAACSARMGNTEFTGVKA